MLFEYLEHNIQFDEKELEKIDIDKDICVRAEDNNTFLYYNNNLKNVFNEVNAYLVSKNVISSKIIKKINI